MKGSEMKENKVLITYATISGSTEEIAQFVRNELAGQGWTVDLRPCREVNDLTGYHAVVIGAPLYMFRLHKDAVRFIQRHQKRLAAMPVAVFAGGPYGPNAAQDAVDGPQKSGCRTGEVPLAAPLQRAAGRRAV
jgi:menaquinone-dependent protoporphyrinogen IX oxidase